MAGAMLALLGGKAKSGQKHPNIYAPYPLIKDFNLSEFLISSILAACSICSRVFLMEFDRFHQFGSLLLHDDFVLSYSGYVTEDILEAVGATLRQRLADHVDSPRQIRNVFSIFVELMQNVIRYGTDGPQPENECGNKESFGLVMVVQKGNCLDIMSGNFIAQGDAEILREKIAFLNQKTPTELRSLYRTRLRQPPEVNSNG